MQPIIGRSGTRCDADPGVAVGQRRLHRSLRVGAGPRPPKPGSHTDQARRTCTSSTSIRSASPGAAPRTLTGPVTRLKLGRPIASTDSPAASRS